MITVFILKLMYPIAKYPLLHLKQNDNGLMPKIYPYDYDFQGPPPRKARLIKSDYV